MSKQIFRMLLGAAVIIGIAALCAGCPTGGGGGGGDPYNPGGGNNSTDTWSNVKSLSQLNGTWKGSFTAGPITLEDFFFSVSFPGINIQRSEKGEETWSINLSTKTVTTIATVTLIFSGEEIDNVWGDMRSYFEAQEQALGQYYNLSIKDADHSFTYTAQLTQQLPEGDISSSNWQISQDGKKIKIHRALQETYEDGTFISEEGGYDLILTKQ